jgi:molybdopterin molybdotransferase
VRTVEEHQAVVAGLLSPLPVEEIPLAEAHGRVLARDVAAAVALPGFDNSAMDGYAARWAEVSTAAGRCRRRHPGRAHRRRHGRGRDP